MPYIPDEKNICIRCKKSINHGLHRPGRYPEFVTWCSCGDPNQTGPNKGERRQCKAFEPRQMEVKP